MRGRLEFHNEWITNNMYISIPFNTYWIDDEKILIECFLALSELGTSHVSPPHTEGLPLAEQGKCGDLNKKEPDVLINQQKQSINLFV